MKLTKTASGKTTIKMSKSEWTNLGKKAGWLKQADWEEDPSYYEPEPPECPECYVEMEKINKWGESYWECTNPECDSNETISDEGPEPPDPIPDFNKEFGGFDIPDSRY